MAHTFTKEELQEAINTSQNIRQVLKKLHMSPKGKNYPNLHNAAKEYSIEIPYKPGKKPNGDLLKITDEQIISAFNNEASYFAIIKSLNLPINGTSNRWIRLKQKELNITTALLGQAHRVLRKSILIKKMPLEQILKENCSYSTNNLKRRLLNESNLIYQCSRCGISEWEGEKLSLELDHINGVANDHRLDNLRLLCPNCHSLTPNYCGKNTLGKMIPDLNQQKQTITLLPLEQRVYTKPKEILSNPPLRSPKENGICGTCLDCKAPIKDSYTGYCIRCKNRHIKNPRPDKIVWPLKEELEKLVWEISTEKVGKQLGVSDKAVEARCKKYGITKPPRGYWNKLAAGQDVSSFQPIKK